MNTNYIKRLIKLVEESEIASLEVSSWGRKVRINKKLTASQNGSGVSETVVQSVVASPPPSPPQPSAAPPTSAPAVEKPADEDIGNAIDIKSPMVGTFYSAPAPDAAPYVSLNEKITVGQVVCIVEAM